MCSNFEVIMSVSVVIPDVFADLPQSVYTNKS